MLRSSLDGIESFYDRIEAFIEETLHQNKQNAATRSSFQDVKITNEYVCVPIHGLCKFTSTDKKRFKKQFPGTKIIGKMENTNTYWIIISRKVVK